jgi:hypothetical protein
MYISSRSNSIACLVSVKRWLIFKLFNVLRVIVV